MEKTVVITGGSSGIGEVLARLYREAGNKVYTLSRTAPQDSEGHILCDVTNEEQVKAAFSVIAGKAGRVDVLVNNAGVGISGATELLDAARVRAVMDVDFLGAFYCCQAALPLMERGGLVVNISSACALFALPFRTVYCAAKAALSMLSYGLRMELAGTGIRVVAVCPGDTKTGFTAHRIKDFATSERYGNRVSTAAHRVDSREEKRMSCERVSRKIFRICAKRRPRASYIVGGKYKVLYALSRVLPINFFLKCTNRFFGGKK